MPASNTSSQGKRIFRKIRFTSRSINPLRSRTLHKKDQRLFLKRAANVLKERCLGRYNVQRERGLRIVRRTVRRVTFVDLDFFRFVRRTILRLDEVFDTRRVWLR